MLLPPPKPWQQVAAIEPDREYVAFTSRFFMRSPGRVLKFLSRTGPVESQLREARGLVGWSLGANLLRLEFYTLSAWEDLESLMQFAHEAEHGAVVREFAGDMRRESLFVHYTVKGRELPLSWKEAVKRQNAMASKVQGQTNSRPI
jgi:hypothetical protein